MTLFQHDAPILGRPRGAALAHPAMQAVVAALANGPKRLAEANRRRREQRALDALPFDLRKDLGWPAGDIRR
ncbi:MAG: hypothetical protein QE284_00545 [Rhizobium sp.]|nr:hypothetical protein [Rhizobium sp.]